MVWTSWILTGIYTLLFLQSFFWSKRISTSKFYISSDRKTPTGTSMISSIMTTCTIPMFLILPTVATTEGGLTKSIIIGLSIIIGSTITYLLIGERLRIYSEITGDSQTVPSYISSRFKDTTGWLRAFAASLITVFMILLAAHTLSTAASITAITFGMSKTSTSVLICGGSLLCLYLGGMSSSTAADRIRSIIIFGTVLAVFIFLLFELIVGDNDHSSVKFIPKVLSSETISVETVFSCLGMSLGCIGFPTAIKRILMIKERKPAKRFCISPLIWCTVTTAGIFLISFIAITNPAPTTFITEILVGLENGHPNIIFNAVIDSLVFVSFLLAIMSITEGSILAAAATFSSDIFNTSITHETDEKKKLIANKVTVLSVGFTAFLLALGNNAMPIMEPSFIWATMGSCFGPVILFSLYCRRLTTKGAVASMTAGLLTVLIWKFILSSIGGIFSVYEILPGFIVSTIVLYLVSYIDRQKPSDRMLNEFGRMCEIVKMPR